MPLNPECDVDVIITPVRSYSDEAQIEAFVRKLINQNSSVLTALLNEGTSGLVVVKPNWVQEAHELKPEVWEPVITHPSIVVAVIRVLADKMRGVGTICVCDAPITNADFNAITKRDDFLTRLKSLRIEFPQLCIELLDLRREVWETKEQVVVRRRKNAPDPRGYVKLNLGKQSHFYGHAGEGRYYGADYDSAVVNEHHHGEVQEYLLAGTPMHCHLFVNLPKLKTHKKTGITCCLKNLVGINGDKNWLPHHTKGSPQSNGDEFPSMPIVVRTERALKSAGQTLALRMPVIGPWIYRKMRRAGKAVLGDSETSVRNGNWNGNDTCWRMALDLNRALLFGNPDGRWNAESKPYLAIVDAIVGGQGNGPLCPDPVESSLIFGGTDPACVDAVACRLAGFDPAALPLVKHAFDTHVWPVGRCSLADVVVSDERAHKQLNLQEVAPAVPGGFRPHFGWKALTGS